MYKSVKTVSQTHEISTGYISGNSQYRIKMFGVPRRVLPTLLNVTVKTDADLLTLKLWGNAEKYEN